MDFKNIHDVSQDEACANSNLIGNRIWLVLGADLGMSIVVTLLNLAYWLLIYIYVAIALFIKLVVFIPGLLGYGYLYKAKRRVQRRQLHRKGSDELKLRMMGATSDSELLGRLSLPERQTAEVALRGGIHYDNFKWRYGDFGNESEIRRQTCTLGTKSGCWSCEGQICSVSLTIHPLVFVLTLARTARKAEN